MEEFKQKRNTNEPEMRFIYVTSIRSLDSIGLVAYITVIHFWFNICQYAICCVLYLVNDLIPLGVKRLSGRIQLCISDRIYPIRITRHQVIYLQNGRFVLSFWSKSWQVKKYNFFGKGTCVRHRVFLKFYFKGPTAKFKRYLNPIETEINCIAMYE